MKEYQDLVSIIDLNGLQRRWRISLSFIDQYDFRTSGKHEEKSIFIGLKMGSCQNAFPSKIKVN
jgi:hypothetical protein